MGLRATVIKKYEIKYGQTQGFNYEYDELANLIQDFCEDSFVGDDDCGGCNPDVIWEINRGQFQGMLTEIKGMEAERFEDEYDLNLEETIRLFEGFLEETPEDSRYVRLGWL